MTGMDPGEDRLVEKLAAEGLISRRRKWSESGAMRGAALVAMLALAFWLGAQWPRLSGPAREPGHRYALLLYEGPAFQAAASGRAGEYGAWARASHEDGEVIGGEELQDNSETLGPSTGGRFQPAGFFIIRARDPRAARRLSLTCPHLRHGGTIEIRPLAD